MREETGSSSISVKLTDENLKFVAGKPLKVDNVNASDGVWWVEDSQGDMTPITGDTKISYLSSTLVMPDETIPELLCYDSCPKPAEDGKTKASNTMDTYDKVMYLQSATGDGGKCKVQPKATDYEVNHNIVITIMTLSLHLLSRFRSLDLQQNQQ